MNNSRKASAKAQIYNLISLMHQQVPETVYNSNNCVVNTLLTKLFRSMTEPSDITFS